MDKKKEENKAEKGKFEEYDPQNPPVWSAGMNEEHIKEVFELSKLKPVELHAVITQTMEAIHEQSLREKKEVARAMQLIRRLNKRH